MNTLFRLDASRDIGTGHLMRCLALAQMSPEKPAFVLALGTSLEERLRKEGVEVVRLDTRRGSLEDADATIGVANERGARWIVVDGYAFDAPYQRHLRDAGFKLFVIDDYAHLPAYDCDVLFNQNIDATASMYEGKTDAKLLLGPKYALLRQEFSAFRGHERTVADVATKVLVTMGGSDKWKGTEKVLEALCCLQNVVLDVRVLVGAENERRGELEGLVAKSPHAVKFEENVIDMPECMTWADLAIAAAGSTSWELLFMGLPFITGILAENQAGIARVLGDRTLAVNVGWYKDCSPERLAMEIERVVSDRELRESLSASGKQTVDGKGVERVVEILQ